MKKLKRFLALALAATMTFSLAACGGKDSDSSKGNKSGVKIGFITLHDENSTYDKNFLDAAKAACEATGAEAVFKTNISEGEDCYDAAADLADGGCDIVFADSFGHEDYMIKAAKEFPDVQFCHATGTKAHTEKLANYHNAFATIYEGRYLAGVVAGLKLNEMIESGKITADQAKIGYVGAYTYAEVISGYTAFFLGARSICESATMEVTFTGSWYDETAEKTAAQALIDDKCVLISQHADSMGAPTACENAGIPNVSYNGSTASACPETFLVSSKIDWAPYFEYIIGQVADKKEIDTDWTGNLSTGSVKLSEFGKSVAEGTDKVVAETQEKLESGDLHVFELEQFTVGGAKLADDYKADVDTDADYTADTVVVKDGYYSESEFRSAPYFDVQIDGIKFLGDPKF